MSTLFLSSDELAELTGFKAARSQSRWLDQNRWRYAVARNSQPKVARDYFDERIGARKQGQFEPANQCLNLEQPNFAALDRR